jgi:hypothetical protein
LVTASAASATAEEAKPKAKFDKGKKATKRIGKGGQPEVKFRGQWTAIIRDGPTFNAFSFLPSPMAQKPRTQKKVAEAAPKEEEEEEEEVAEEEEELPLLYEVPEGREVLLSILDRYSNYRGYIDLEGGCFNNLDQNIGFINVDAEQAGTADLEYLGSVHNTFAGNYIEVHDAVDDMCGTLDLGTCYLKDATSITVGEVMATGVVTGHSGSFLGQFEGFSYAMLRVIALYLMLIDPGMLNEH